MLAGLAALIFLPTALFCGLYLDDYSFLRMLEGATGYELWRHFIEYVPGRNLHIPFFYALIRLTGGSVPGMHAISIAFDAANAAMLFLFVRRLTGLRAIAWAAAVIFILAPNHGETHYWITLIPQCQIPTFLILAAFLLATSPAGPRLTAAASVYAVALFTYDQVFFLWPLLLFVAWRANHSIRRRNFVLAAFTLAALNVTHIVFRYLSPYASGGRPLIRLSDFFRRGLDAIVATAKGIIPIPTPSYAHWGWTILVAVIALALGIWMVRRIAEEIRAEKLQYASWTQGREWIWIVVFGTAWTGLAYAPNLFWFISPRHNLLPSIGWAIALASIGAVAATRIPRLSSILPTACVLAFMFAALSNVHEGTQWIESKRMKEAYAAEVRQVAAPADTLFLVGAPRYLHRAPAFNLPHDVALAAARVLGRPSLVGDYSVSPTRTGIVYYNDLSIVPANAFNWLPAANVNLVSYDENSSSFQCAAMLSLQEPGGGQRELPLRPSRGCKTTVKIPLEVALVESETRPAPTNQSVSGISLLHAEIRTHERMTSLVLEWAMGAPPSQVLALIPRLKDQNGNTILDSVFYQENSERNRLKEALFRSHNPKRPYPVLWPLVDDMAPLSEMKPGQVLRQVFELRKTISGPYAEGLLEVDLFQIKSDGSTQNSGHFAVPVVIKPAA